MKVTHLCHCDGGGGAAVAAVRLHGGLRGLGVDSGMVVGRKLGVDPSVIGTLGRNQARVLKRLDRLPRRWLRTPNQSLISPAWIGSSAWRRVNRGAPDIAHVHWICEGFVRIADLGRLRSPVVWSMHDMWALAGGEHYVDGCTRYRDGYRRGNRPAGESGFDLNRWVWRRKLRAWSRLPELTVFAVSRWMADRARESVLLRDRPIEILHNALDPDVFQPMDRRAARSALGLPIGQPLVLYGALEATRDRRKGFDLLQQALTALRAARSDVGLVVFGNEPGAAPAPTVLAGFPVHYLGRFGDPAELARVYAACDVMVVPSREEAFGQTALESLACGTPVAAFRVGGLPEVIDHGITGYLAAPFDTADLAAGIGWILDCPLRGAGHRLAEAARERVLKDFTLKIQAERCRDLYARVLERRRP